MKITLIFIILTLISSCSTEETKLEKALRLAGNNRPELEKVLQHYSQTPTDSLKLYATRFLIENMPGHYTLTGEEIEQFKEKIQADTFASYFAKKALQISISNMYSFRKNAQVIEDVESINAEFLIRHINNSFERLNTCPWLRDIPFELFLEYILPYRFEHEQPDLWTDSLRITPNAWEEINALDLTKYAAWNKIDKLELTRLEPPFHKTRIIQWLQQDIYDMCQHIALRDLLESRASALPSTTDFIPYFANRNGFHYWNRIISPEAKKISLRGTLERKAAKIYRKTYSLQNEIIPLEGEYIPEFFRKSFYKDVSDEYMYTADISIPAISPVKSNPRFAYLFVFNYLKWVPVAIGNFNEKGTVFKKMGKNIVYLPGFYHKKRTVAANYPFILNLKGQPQYLVPDTTNRQNIRLTRKYPSNYVLYTYNKQMADITVVASSSSSFTFSDTLLTHLEVGDVLASGKIKPDKAYRYWQVIIPKNVACAEIVFVDCHGRYIQGKVSDTTYAAGFDNNPLTNLKTNLHKTPIIDFGSPVQLSKIIVLPRSDGNSIYPENEYELFYYTLDGWTSLGRQIADDYCLNFYNIPRGALYWLHNWTSGMEERIFTINENNEIQFW